MFFLDINSSFLLFCFLMFFVCPTAFLLNPTKIVTQHCTHVPSKGKQIVCSPARGNQVNINLLLMESIFSVRCVIEWLKLLHFEFVF